MSNIVEFKPRLRSNRAANLIHLTTGVAGARCRPDDVFWLKENAEVLNVFAATEERLQPLALEPYRAFYDQIEERLRFYPQYYRFFLSICLDLEDLGLEGHKGEVLCRWAAEVGLAEAELSDLQRAEAQRLLARRGAADPLEQSALGWRLAQFVERPENFALPNKKVAYELTHIVFYLSEYGRRDPGLTEAVLVSLEFTGLIAFLDQDHDLLAEVCLALRFAGKTPSAIWSEAVGQAHASILPVVSETGGSHADDFHRYLVTGWAQHAAGEQSFETEVPLGPLSFMNRSRAPGALRSLSMCLFELGSQRRRDWLAMRQRVMVGLDHHAQAILERAEASSERFEAFFEGFSRASG